MAEAMAPPAGQTQLRTTLTDPEPKVAPPPPASVAPAPASTAEGNRKRKLELEEFQRSDHFKLRCLVKDIRPLFLEIIQAPDIRNTNLAHDIQKRMKTMTELLQNLKDKTAFTEKLGKMQKNVSSFQGKNEEISKSNDHEKPFTPLENNSSLSDKMEDEACDEAISAKANTEEKAALADDGQDKAPQGINITGFRDEVLQGTYVVGGSKVGCNFLVYLGGKPVYYGETKESALARRVKE